MFANLIFGDLTDRTNPITAKAMADARDTCEREDIPNSKDVPLHLRDEAPRFYKTKSGYRTTARLHVNDVLMGDDSVVQVALHAASPAIIALLGLFAMISPWLAGTMAAGLWWFYVAMGVRGGGNFAVLMVLTALSGTLFHFLAKAGLDISALSGGTYLLTAIVTAATPFILDLKYGAERERELLEQGQKFSGASHGAKDLIYSKPSEARAVQIERAKKDTTPFLVLGEAQGIFAAASQDPFAIDAKLPIGLSIADMFTHMVVFGTTGSGKTSGVLRPVAAHWVLKNPEAGMLAGCGKGSLGQELADLPGMELITPGVTPFSLTQGMRAEEISAVLRKFGTQFSTGGDPFWPNGAHPLCTFAFLLLENAKTLGDGYKCTLNNGRRIIADEAWRQECIQDIQESRMEISTFLQAAIDYFQIELPGMEGPTRNGIIATALSWINPLLQTRELRAWAEADDGIDVTEVLKGKKYALNVSPARYGPAAILAMQFIKSKVYNALRRREGRDWQVDPTEKQALILLDEAQSLIADGVDQEGGMIPQARSWGTAFVLGMQTLNSAMAAFIAQGSSKEACSAMLDCCNSIISFRSSHDTMQYVRERLKKCMRREVVAVNEGIAYDALAKSILESSALRSRSFWLRLTERLRDPSALVGTIWGKLIPRSGTATAAGRMEDGKVTKRNPDGTVTHEFGISSTYQMKLDWVFSEAEEIFLEKPQVAAALLMNSGVVRRDIYQSKQMFDFSAVAAKAAA